MFPSYLKHNLANKHLKLKIIELDDFKLSLNVSCVSINSESINVSYCNAFKTKFSEIQDKQVNKIAVVKWYKYKMIGDLMFQRIA